MNSAKEEPPVISLTEEAKNDGLYQDGEKDLDEPGTVPAKYRGTAHDKRDMSILGKKQVLRVCALPVGLNKVQQPCAMNWFL